MVQGNFILYWICLLLVLVPLLLEFLWLQRRRTKVPIRIHVHGTRGKSSITRELTASLRTQGLQVLAKTTGDRPEYVLPDGTVIPVRRIGPARIQEHVATLRKAISMGTDAVVVEGMALQPETVYLSEKILQATHAIIANARPDHTETMGAGRQGVLRTLRHLIPSFGELFTSDETGADFLRELATRQNVSCSIVKAPPMKQVTALAQAVSGSVLAGKNLSENQKSMFFSALSPPFEAEFLGMPICAYDFLSANDVLSSQFMLGECSLYPDFFSVAMLATRADRPFRTRHFLDWLLVESRFDAVAVMGNHAGYGLLYGLFSGSQKRFLRVRPGQPPDRLLRAMIKKSLVQGKKGITVVALGNVHGYGELWRTALQHSLLLLADTYCGAGQNK